MEDWVYVGGRRRSGKKPQGGGMHAGRHSNGHSSYVRDARSAEPPPVELAKHAEKTFGEVKRVMSGLEKSEFFAKFLQQLTQVVDEAKAKIKCAICLGLGSLEDPNWSNRRACLYQLSFVLLLGRIHNVEQLFIYDPKIGEVDEDVCGRFGVEVLSPREEAPPEGPQKRGEAQRGGPQREGPQKSGEAQIEGPPSGAAPKEGEQIDRTIPKPRANERTLLFMPHCDVSLYSQVMHDIYVNEKLSYDKVHFLLPLAKTIFLGNSFEYYREHVYMYRPFGIPAYAIRMLKSGGTLPEGATQRSLNRLEELYKMDHFLFYIHKYAREGKFPFCPEHVSAFNDMAIITFGPLPDQLSFWKDVWAEVTSGGPT
ncbi:hypothetical protein PVIIG_06475 [Plasmodium vivax India VII]|uniref:SRR1-like domain-containing protein n=3 Tax=Plasmodium vivax TaxID=5855 RepID=A5KBZ5_PLAVS|nr:hypothetical protein, conserved [Plasmodium vivax]EDL43191.1 hypothetical protein, conserved [Plasmodium vivax]KMZ82172.1 hypothetical protein PVIIG_06475 [Plasmodium vivax India VII]SCO65626.1 SRR1-like protein [Plasmodium vivax]VUZ93773.1 SRR1-like protein [Plasmodium vivax]|eukprot:XP_001612918.1 hypothetical protein [Plasmodium vivax Sal-1]